MGSAVVLLGPRRLALERYDDPPLAPGEVRLRTLHSGISAGTELAAYRGTSPHLHKAWDPRTRLFAPATAAAPRFPVRDLGYEEVGEVVEVGPGPDAEGPAPGELVFGTWGHRSHHVVPAALARERRLPPGVPPLAGIFSHIGSVALNGVHDAGVRIGETVALFGLGVRGQIAAQLLKRSGATVIGVDPIAERLDLAGRLGAVDVGLRPGEGPVAERIRDLTGGRGADVALEVSGAVPALHEAVRSVAYAARVVAMGFYQGGAAALALGEEFHHNRVEIASSQISGVAPERSGRWTRLRLAHALMRLQAEGALDLPALVTHRRPLAQAAEAFRLLDESPADALQVVLDVHDGEGTTE